MEPPRRKRRNTIGIKFVKGTIKDVHYRKVFEDVLHIRNEHILKIQEYNNTHFMFKVGPENYKMICRDFANKFYPLDEETSIMVEDISNYSTEVRVSNIGLELETDEVLYILSLYGDIHSYFYRTRPNVEYFNDRETGRMTIKMDVKKEIPSTLFIKDTHTLLHIGYRGQTPTCNRCGSKDHRIRSCVKEPGTGSNVFDFEFDIDNESNYGDDDSDNNTSVSQNDETSTPEGIQQSTSVSQTEVTSTQEGIQQPASASQNEETSTPEAIQQQTSVSPTEETSTPGAQQVSNTVTSQEDVVSVTHMLTHTGELPDPIQHDNKTNLNKIAHTGELHKDVLTGENSECNLATESGIISHSTNHTGEENINTCKICNFNFDNLDDLTEHTQAHEGQVPFKCLDCTYKTSCISDLTNHMQGKKHMLNLIHSPQNTTANNSFAHIVKKLLSPASQNTPPTGKQTRYTYKRLAKKDKKDKINLPNQ